MAVGILSLKDLDLSFLFVSHLVEYDGSSKAPLRRCTPATCGLTTDMTAEGWGRRLVLLFTTAGADATSP